MARRPVSVKGISNGVGLFPFRAILPVLFFFLYTCQNGQDFAFTQEILLISREAEIALLGNNPDPAEALNTLAAMSTTLKGRISPDDPPDSKINKINQYLYKEWGVLPQPDTSTLENTSLHSVLKTRKASCLGLVCLYLAITEDMDLPLYGVLLPGHLFLRYSDDRVSINIETLKAGIARTDPFYRDHFKVPATDIYYLQNLGSSEVTGLLLYNLGNECRARERYEDAAGYYRRALKLFPGFAEGWANLGNIYQLTGEKPRADKALAKAYSIRPELKDTEKKH